MSDLRLATMEDLESAVQIFEQAIAYLASQGIDQWQSGYPNRESVVEDIAASNLYVLDDEKGVVAVAALVFGGEPCYEPIYEGKWQTPEPYACIHRLAVRRDCRGGAVADALTEGLLDEVRSRGIKGVRVDTHRQNVRMQRMLERNGFARCGVIYLPPDMDNGAERIAFDRMV